MHPLLGFLLLSLSAAALPPRHHLYSAGYLHDTAHQQQQPPPPQQSIEVSRPIPFDSISPSCTLPILSHTFALPAAVATYSPPSGCHNWSRAVLYLSGACNGTQSDRIAAVWLDGVELLRTSTPKPAPDGVFWNVKKDVSRYTSLLRNSNVSLVVMLENLVDGVNHDVYHLNLTFLYYDGAGAGTGVGSVTAGFPLSLPRAEELGKNSEAANSLDSFNLNENPADLIIPVSSNGDEGFWFKIPNEFDSARKGIQIPINAYRAVIELYVSSHEKDEFWYSIPPKKDQFPSKEGNGPYREIEVKIDNTVVGSVIPFPVIYTGAINVLYWKPLVPIGAFDLPSYQLELTPILGMLLDGRSHTFELEVTGGIPYWLINANLHLWLDGGANKVLAGIIRIKYPRTHVKINKEFRGIDGKAVVKGNRQGTISGWVSYSAGNFTTWVEHKMEAKNDIDVSKGGHEKVVKQTAERRTRMRVDTDRHRILQLKVKSKYYLQITNMKVPSLAKDANLTYGRMENRMLEKEENGEATYNLNNSQKCHGWLLSRGEDIMSGTASTLHQYEEKDRVNCYRRRAYAEGGIVKEDMAVPCSRFSSE